jgi:basic amino acid/polyamine antiporter, APA family
MAQTQSSPDPNRKLGLLAAVTIVVSNMVGTGVFTSLGFQAAGINDALALLLLWVVGGLLALCGGFAYGELGSAFPRSGGEYHYLSRLYHPSVGFLSGFVSATVGFAAPVALAAMAFGQYLHGAVPMLDPKVLATVLVLCVTAVHLGEVRLSGRFQSGATLLMIGLVVVFVFCGLFITPHPVAVSLRPTSKTLGFLFSPSFAVSLVYVSYAYSGWNGSTYIASEIKNPSAMVPRSILTGTAVVIALYLLLNYAFLRSTPIVSLAGQLDVGLLSGTNVFGTAGGKVMAVLISLCLVATTSSMILAGPRVLKTIGEDYTRLAFFSRETPRGIPWVAILTQSTIALVLLWTSSFEKVLTYIGFTLALFTSLSVLGTFILRARKVDKTYAYKTTGFPVTPVLFLALSLWMIVFLIQNRLVESLAGFATLVVAGVVYLLVGRSRTNG